MRLIDADTMLAELKPVGFEAGYKSMPIADVSTIMRDWVSRQPTITPSGWVSVEERLPDKPCRVLVRVTGLDILDIDTDRLVNGRWIRWPGYVTHWMLLPAPPDRRPPEGEANE